MEGYWKNVKVLYRFSRFTEPLWQKINPDLQNRVIAFFNDFAKMLEKSSFAGICCNSQDTFETKHFNPDS